MATTKLIETESEELTQTLEIDKCAACHGIGILPRYDGDPTCHYCQGKGWIINGK